jgi:hemoglobin-like flavoprotein
MDTVALITRSLELAGEHGDPMPAIYARVFATHPEMEKLFVRDTTGIVKGSMLTEALTAMLDLMDRDVYGGNFMRAEIVNHENLGVPREVFATFFHAMRDTFADFLGASWTNDIDAAWKELLDKIGKALAPQM